MRTAARELELDMLILATGYDGLTGALMAFDVVGREGRTINKEWAAGGQSHLGLMMAGFPNLFMICGPNGPSALANIFTINEQNVDWVADAIMHMRATGTTAMEPTAAAQQAWMDMIAVLAENTLLSKAKTWYTGTNIAGKALGLTMYTGGFNTYAELCRASAESGYADMAFEGIGQPENSVAA